MYTSLLELGTSEVNVGGGAAAFANNQTPIRPIKSDTGNNMGMHRFCDACSKRIREGQRYVEISWIDSFAAPTQPCGYFHMNCYAYYVTEQEIMHAQPGFRVTIEIRKG